MFIINVDAYANNGLIVLDKAVMSFCYEKRLSLALVLFNSVDNKVELWGGFMLMLETKGMPQRIPQLNKWAGFKVLSILFDNCTCAYYCLALKEATWLNGQQ